MKYNHDEASAADHVAEPGTGAAISAEDHDELTELASDMRALWRRVKSGIVLSAEFPGLQRQQYWVLGALASGPRRMSDLAECAQTSQTSLTGIVDRLEEHGFVVRVRSAEDRRVVDVALTDKGRDAGRAAEAAFLERLQDIVRPLDPAERTEFRRLVRKLLGTSP